MRILIEEGAETGLKCSSDWLPNGEVVWRSRAPAAKKAKDLVTPLATLHHF